MVHDRSVPEDSPACYYALGYEFSGKRREKEKEGDKKRNKPSGGKA